MIYNGNTYHKPVKRRRYQPPAPIRTIIGQTTCPCCQGARRLGQNYRPCPICKATGVVPVFAE